MPSARRPTAMRPIRPSRAKQKQPPQEVNTMSDSVIRLQNVHKRFGITEVLRGVNLSIERGQTFALLGRNGAGKTTLIRLLLGLLRRESGSIAVLGRDPQHEALQVR